MEGRLEDIENAKIDGKDVPSGKKRKLKARLHRRSRLTSINEQGKLQVPKDCQEAVGLPLGGEVVLVGSGQWFEIWAPQDLEASDSADDNDDLDDLEEEIGT